MPIAITREEFHEIYKQGEEATFKLFEKLVERINALETRVAELEARLNKDSHNSSKPPSSDMFRPPKSLRGKSDKPNGGQPGHEGRSLKQVENPDHVQEHPLSGKCECGRDLAKGKKLGCEKRQVFDVPKPSLEVTEHRAETRECACGRHHTASFPDGVNAPVQYGPNVRSILVYLSQYQLLPQRRTTEAMADLFGVTISEGTVNKTIQEVHNRLEATEKAIRENIRGAPVAHGDETGIYIGGQRWWQHVFSTALFTYFFCHPKRGTSALNDDGILERFVGRLIHDGWRSYFDLECLHGLCNAHHLRELVFLSEECNERWAETMIKHLCHIKSVVDRARAAGRKHLSPHTLQRYRKRYEAIVACGNRANPPQTERKIPGSRGRIKQTPARNLLERLNKHADETLAFMYDFNVPFDNNLSERDLRMSKVKQKVSGCFRSTFGAQAFCRIRSYISTVRKHGLSVFDHIVKCFDPAVTHSVLLPVGRK
jgi:transposase